MMTAALAAPAMAQDPAEPQIEREAAKRTQVAELYQKLASVAIQARITTGAPYSAEAVTESTQVLADGNRIVRKTVTRVYRDGEGRSRREEIDPDTGALRTVSITDPVAGSTYTLDPATRTAYQNGVTIATPAGFAGVTIGAGGRGRGTLAMPRGADVGVTVAGRSETEQAMREKKIAEARSDTEQIIREKQIADAKASAEGRGGATLYAARGRGAVPIKVSADGGETTREDLGPQTVEGIAATGTRATTVIPAGAIGNLQPIKIVSEQWTSPDLKVLVLTRHSDPRVGETIYRLSNLVRAEPDRSLFMVPPDYTLKEPSLRRDQ
jgi:hypothetical protein